jgi:hypothetical protein
VSKLDPLQTIIKIPDEISWTVPAGAPPDSVAEAGIRPVSQAWVDPSPPSARRVRADDLAS